MPNMERSLQLKKLVAVDGKRYPAMAPLNIHTLMKAAFDKAATVGDRHFPPKDGVKPGKRCVFLEPVTKPGSSIQFHIYAYTAGHTPDQVIPDFNAAKADIKDDPIKQDGKVVEVVQRFACLVYGDAIIIENARVYGAAPLAIMAIRELIRRHASDKFPLLRLEDLPNKDFKKHAAIHDGVVEVIARLNNDFTPEPDSFGRALEDLIVGREVGNFKQITATIKGTKAEPLDPDKVLELVEESDGSTGLSGISVFFGDGSSMSDLDKFRERHRIVVQELGPGRPAVTEIETAMVDYLKSLITPDDENARIMDINGIFIQ